MEKVLDRFLRYVSFETTSDENSSSYPSTKGQVVLLDRLLEELKAMGVDARKDENGYVLGTIPSNVGPDAPSIGFIAHVDTSPDAAGGNIKPQIIKDYDLSAIPLKGVDGLSLDPKEYPVLGQFKGCTLVTTDGTTLLGADDKAGVSEIMTAVEYVMTHPEFKHPGIKVAFTPDEEIGRGVDHFDVKAFGADWAYTMDGGLEGELEYENFNAASAKVRIKGLNIHPGYAKGKMKNAIRLGEEFDLLLGDKERPETTEGYEGFFHLTSFTGDVSNATLSYIIRDHDALAFGKRKQNMLKNASIMNLGYGEGCVQVEITEQYRNMKEMIEPHIHIVEDAKAAMTEAGVTPIVRPIRGGTDGARLSFMGLPCPNIFAGGINFHSVMEFVPVESMEKAVKVILGILSINAESLLK